MDLTELLSIAKFQVGDAVLKFGAPYRVVGRYYSRRRGCVVYDLRPLDDPHAHVEPKVGEALLVRPPRPDEDDAPTGPIDPEWPD